MVGVRRRSARRMTPAARLAATERAFELLGRDPNAEREMVGYDLDKLEARLFELLRSHGATESQLDVARARWSVDPDRVMLELFGEEE